MHISELLAYRAEPVETWSTGFDVLDRLTGGFARGQLWVITGAPGTGRTTLLTQFVYGLATEHRFTVRFHTARSEPPEEVQARMLSLACREPRRHPRLPVAHTPAGHQAELAALREADLRVHSGRGWSIGLDWGDTEHVCLAIDEPEFNRPPVLAREGLDELRQFADRPGIALVTMPRSHCLEQAPNGDRLREEWASVADVMVEIAPTNDFGDVELRVLRNRRGPTGVVPAVLHQHLARFVQTRPTQEAYT